MGKFSFCNFVIVHLLFCLTACPGGSTNCISCNDNTKCLVCKDMKWTGSTCAGNLLCLYPLPDQAGDSTLCFWFRRRRRYVISCEITFETFKILPSNLNHVLIT